MRLNDVQTQFHDIFFVQTEDRTPFVIVALQECERMNALTNELKRSLGELDLGLKVIIEENTKVEKGRAHLSQHDIVSRAS